MLFLSTDLCIRARLQPSSKHGGSGVRPSPNLSLIPPWCIPRPEPGPGQCSPPPFGLCRLASRRSGSARLPRTPDPFLRNITRIGSGKTGAELPTSRPSQEPQNAGRSSHPKDLLWPAPEREILRSKREHLVHTRPCKALFFICNPSSPSSVRPTAGMTAQPSSPAALPAPVARRPAPAVTASGCRRG